MPWIPSFRQERLVERFGLGERDGWLVGSVGLVGSGRVGLGWVVEEKTFSEGRLVCDFLVVSFRCCFVFLGVWFLFGFL